MIIDTTTIKPVHINMDDLIVGDPEIRQLLVSDEGIEKVQSSFDIITEMPLIYENDVAQIDKVLGKRKRLPFLEENEIQEHELIPEEDRMQLRKRSRYTTDKDMLQLEKQQEEHMDRLKKRELIKQTILDMDDVPDQIKQQIADELNIDEVYRKHFGQLNEGQIQQIFSFAVNKKVGGKATFSGVCDILIFLQCLYVGGVQIAKYVNNTYTKWKNAIGSGHDNKRIFVESCQTVFSRPQMFSAFLSLAKLGKSSKKLFDALRNLCLQDIVEDEDQMVYKTKLEAILSDKQIINKTLHDVIIQAFNSEELVQLSMATVNMINKWRNPSENMIRTLKLMLLGKKAEMIQGDDTEQDKILQKKIAEKIWAMNFG